MIMDKRMEKTLGQAFREDQALKALSEAVISMEEKYESLDLEPGIRGGLISCCQAGWE